MAARSRSGGILLLAMILLAPAMASVAQAQVPTSPTQPPYVICLYGYVMPPGQTGVDCPNAQTGSVSANPNAPGQLTQANYFEGQNVEMTLNANTNANVVFDIECQLNCKHTNGDTNGRTFEGTWDGNVNHHLVFPANFVDTITNVPAAAEGAGTYNSTWSVTATVVKGAIQPQRTFGTWVQDSFLTGNNTVMPGENHEFHMFGYSDNARLSILVERREGSKFVPVTFDQFHCVIGTTGQLCRVRYAPAEGANIAGCGADLSACYRVTVSGTGKDTEVVTFAIAPAHLTPLITPFTSPPANATAPYTTLERTQNVTVAVDLAYPGGDAAYRVPLTDAGVPVDPVTGTHVLRLNVQRQDVGSPTMVGQVVLAYQPDLQRWQGVWTPPRDAALNASLVAYSLQLLDGRDLYANQIDPVTLANYTLKAANLEVNVIQGLVTAPRTEPIDVQLLIRYHDGELYDRNVSWSPPMGCFLRVTQTSASAGANCTSASSDQVVTLTYESGLWHARYRYAKDYATLGTHAFILEADNDSWGNNVPGGQPLATYQVVAGSPHIAFRTVFQGIQGSPIVRSDDTLYLNADITYGDGSAFNNTAVPSPDGQTRTLTALVTKRTTDNVNVTTVPVTLRGDPYSPHWTGSLALHSNQSDTPLGMWGIELNVADNVTTPNQNDSTFSLTVVGARLQFREESPPYDAEIGNKTHFRFSILRDGSDDSAAIRVGTTLSAYLVAFDPSQAAPVGPPIAKLYPGYNPDYREYTIDYQVPPEMYAGTYVFIVRGGDADGNMLGSDGVSHVFHTYASPRIRSVVTQPPVSAQRGDTATVVFDGIAGDTGLNGTGDPVVHVDYFNPGSQQWERKVDSVGSNDSAPNHLGVFPITIDTNVGIYRFTLDGRQADHHVIVAISANFTVTPADVGRFFVADPPENVTKGAPFAFSFERQPGDIIYKRTVLYEGRPIAIPPPTLQGEDLLYNASWGVPFDAPSGHYTLHLEGADRSGNHIDIVVPPIDVQAIQLVGKILGNPSPAVARGTPATVLFGITYPPTASAFSNAPQFYLDAAIPRAVVYNASGVVAQANVVRTDLTFTASWTPPPTADATSEYWFQMSGDAVAGDSFPALQTSSFRLAPGSFLRTVATDVGTANVRGDTLVVQVPASPDDVSAQFSLAYYGPNDLASAGTLDGHDPVSTTLLASRLDPAASRYVARFVTDLQTAPGSYLITMTGLDAHGNAFTAASRPFLLTTASALVQWDAPLASDALHEGKTVTTSFTARYQNTNAPLDDTKGKPSVALLYNGQPTSAKPDVAYQGGHWVISWVAPDTLPAGTYVFTVGGSDFGGNQILTSQQNAILYDPSFGQSLAKVVPHLLPAPEPGLLLGAILACALLARRLRR